MLVVHILQPIGTSTVEKSFGYSDATWDRPAFLSFGQTSAGSRMPTAVLNPGERALPLPLGDPLDLRGMTFHDALFDRPMSADDFLNRRLFNDGLLVLHSGLVRHESYRNGFTERDHHLCHSVTKTLTTMMVGIAVEQGLLHVNMPIATYVPQLSELPAWAPVTLQHVLDMATGITSDEHYEKPDSMYWRYAYGVGYYGSDPSHPAHDLGALGFILRELTTTDTPPGFRFNYASYLTNLLPMALENVYQRPAAELYEEHLFGRIGAEAPCLLNIDAHGCPIVEGQISLTLRDLARWAGLYVTGGRNLAGEQIVPNSWIEETIASSPARLAAFARGDSANDFPGGQYHNKTWVVNADRQRFAMLGIHGQFAYFDLPAELMVVGFGSFPEQVAPLMGQSLQQLWSVITDVVTT
jgi:CubicO group peptidase (beta-lactamase class C family)